MRKAWVKVNGITAGILEAHDDGKYVYIYQDNYLGAPISLTMSIQKQIYTFSKFPPFFEGLLPEGVMLEALLRKYKLDKHDYFAQLMKVGHDMVGNITVEEIV